MTRRTPISHDEEDRDFPRTHPLAMATGAALLALLLFAAGNSGEGDRPVASAPAATLSGS